MVPSAQPNLMIATGSLVSGVSTERKKGSPLDALPKNVEVLTHFGERGDISTDGRFMTFQIARTKDEAGVGYGICLM